MKKKLTGIIIIACIIYMLPFCNTQNNDGNKNDLKNHQKADTAVKDIPIDKNGLPVSYYMNKTAVEAKLGLNTLETGFDSLQIRIWYGYAFKDSSQLVILKNTGGRWWGDFFTLVYHLNEERDAIVYIDKVVESKEPKDGWETVFKNLLNLNILTLPDYHSIPDYSQGADGDAVIVEVSTKKMYRIYSYQEPELFRNKHWQAKKMEQILELMEDEFKFSPLRKL